MERRPDPADRRVKLAAADRRRASGHAPQAAGGAGLRPRAAGRAVGGRADGAAGPAAADAGHGGGRRLLEPRRAPRPVGSQVQNQSQRVQVSLGDGVGTGSFGGSGCAGSPVGPSGLDEPVGESEPSGSEGVDAEGGASSEAGAEEDDADGPGSPGSVEPDGSPPGEREAPRRSRGGWVHRPRSVVGHGARRGDGGRFGGGRGLAHVLRGAVVAPGLDGQLGQAQRADGQQHTQRRQQYPAPAAPVRPAATSPGVGGPGTPTLPSGPGGLEGFARPFRLVTGVRRVGRKGPARRRGFHNRRRPGRR